MKSPKDRTQIYARDRMLAEKARSGDEDSRNELVRLYEPLARKIAYSFRQYTEDSEDLSQAALLRLTRRIKDYDGSKAEFITFAWNLMLWEIKDIVDLGRKRAKRLVSLYQTIGEDEGELVQILEDKKSPKVTNGVVAEARSYLKNYLRVLKKNERVIVERVLAGKSREEIAEEIGKSKSYVKGHYELALRRLRHSIENSEEKKGIESLLS